MALEAVLTSTYNLCFRAKIENNVCMYLHIPLKIYKSGCTGVKITQSC